MLGVIVHCGSVCA